MKKLLLNLFLVLGILTLAQNKRFIYEYKFTPDPKNASNIETEMMFLDTAKDGSKYYSYTVLNSDSLIKADTERQMKVNDSAYVKPDLRKGIVRYSVTKTYPDYKVNLHKSIEMYAYKIPEDRKINWKISSEKEKIGEWNAQKAEADFAGRHWIAWFSTDIPIQDGPYKFSGLPGLILEMEDSTGTHIFKFAGSRKFVEVEKIEKEDIGSTRGGIVVKTFGVPGGKEIEVSEEQFKKQWKEYKNDPVKDTRQILSQGNMKLTLNVDGKIITEPSQVLREMEKNQREEIKNNNNKIEPALYP